MTKWAMDEASFQDGIAQIAKIRGWRRAHFAAARTEVGWRTPVRYDAQGWPDLVLVKGARMLCLELKGEKGRPTADQTEWVAALDQVPGVLARICWPRDYDWIIAQLEATDG